MAYDNIKNKLLVSQVDIVGLIDTKLDVTGNAVSATKATQDSLGRQINTTYLTISGGTVSGNLTVTGALKGSTVQATSDQRLKTNIHPIDCDVSSLCAYSYNLKDDADHTHVGLLAQEVQKCLPQAVSSDDNGYLSLDYNAVVAILVNKINKIEAKLKLMENKDGE